MSLQTIQTLLFVPAGVDRFVASAITHKPDAVILDLEDAVALEAKPAARTRLAANLTALAAARIPAIVRVNADRAQMQADFAALDLGKTAAILVAKCGGARDLDCATELLALREAESGATPLPLLALIESPATLFRLEELSEHPRLAGMMFGSEDYAAELGTSPDSLGIQIGASLMVATCSKRGLLPIGLAGSIGNFADLDSFRAVVERSRQLGFRAAAAIHPKQLPLIREGFAPSESEVARAKDIVAAFEKSGGAAVALDGKMLDAPIVAQARRVLAQAMRNG